MPWPDRGDDDSASRSRARRDAELHLTAAVRLGHSSRPLGGGAVSGHQGRICRGRRSFNQPGGQPRLDGNTPADTPLSQPYWLREDHTAGMFRVDDPKLIGRPENPPVFPVEQVFEVGGQTLDCPRPTGAGHGQPGRKVKRAAIWMSFRRCRSSCASDVSLFAPGATRPVTVEVTAARPGIDRHFRLDTPGGWKAAPATQSFSFESRRRQSTIHVHRHRAAGTHDRQYHRRGGNRRQDLRQRARRNQLSRTSRCSCCNRPPGSRPSASTSPSAGKKVGYLPGAGDERGRMPQGHGLRSHHCSPAMI